MKTKQSEGVRGLVLGMGVMLLWLVAGCDQSVRTQRISGVDGPGLVPLTNMVLIKAGSFVRMQQPVMLTNDFWIGRYEVTQAEYEAVMGTNPSHFAGEGSRPVEKVSQIDAALFCRRLTEQERKLGRLPLTHEYRVPYEAEWEYACRAGTTNAFSFGDEEDLADGYAWTDENSEGSTHPVGTKLPNPWGLHDMHGNVWEWCQDWFGEFGHSPVTNPAGPSAGEYKVFRGGGWSHEAKFARAANRFMMAPGNGIYFVGFRVVLARVASGGL